MNKEILFLALPVSGVKFFYSVHSGGHTLEQEIYKGYCYHGFDHYNGPGYDDGIVAADNLNLDIFIILVCGSLGFSDGCGGLYSRSYYYFGTVT